METCSGYDSHEPNMRKIRFREYTAIKYYISVLQIMNRIYQVVAQTLVIAMLTFSVIAHNF